MNNSEWALANTGFLVEGIANGTAYAQNAAQFLTGGPNGGTTKIWIDSDHFGLNGSDLQSALSAYSLTDTGFQDFTLPTLQNYSAIFLGGDTLTSTEEADLVSYINAGGSVYIMAGTDVIGNQTAAGEAAQWNAVLNPFSLTLASTYDNVDTNVPTPSTSPVLNGVSVLFNDGGNSVSATGPNAQVIAQYKGSGIIGTYSSAPEPSTAFLILGALAGLPILSRRHRRPAGLKSSS